MTLPAERGASSDGHHDESAADSNKRSEESSGYLGSHSSASFQPSEKAFAYDPSDFDTRLNLPTTGTAGQNDYDTFAIGQFHSERSTAASSREGFGGNQTASNSQTLGEDDTAISTENAPLPTVHEGRRLSSFDASGPGRAEDEPRSEKLDTNQSQPSRKSTSGRRDPATNSQCRQDVYHAHVIDRSDHPARQPGSPSTTGQFCCSDLEAMEAMATDNNPDGGSVGGRRSYTNRQSAVPASTIADSCEHPRQPAISSSLPSTASGSSSRARRPDRDEAAPSGHGSKYIPVTAQEPISDKPVWSLGAPLPRVRRAPASRTKSKDRPTDTVAQPQAEVEGKERARRPLALLSRRTGKSSSRERGLKSEDVIRRDTHDPGAAHTDQETARGQILPRLGSAARLTQDVRQGWAEADRAAAEEQTGAQSRRSSVPPRRDQSEQVLNRDLDHHADEDAGRRLREARRHLLAEAGDIRDRSARDGAAGENDEAVQEEEEGLPAPMKDGKIRDRTTSSQRRTSLHRSSHRTRRGSDHHGDRQEEQREDLPTEAVSSMDQARHPGLSGARPPPRGRTAGGPAVGVGTRHASTSSTGAQHQQQHTAGPQLQRSASSHMSARTRRSSRPISTHKRPQGDVEGWEGEESQHTDEKRNSSERVAVGDDGRIGQIEPRGRQSDSDADDSRPRHSEGWQSDTRLAWKHNAMGRRHSSSGSSEATATNSQYGQDDGASQTARRRSSETYAAVEDLPRILQFPNRWSKWRFYSREFLAELMASMLLLIIGTGVNCQVRLSAAMDGSGSAGSYSSQNVAWGLAIMSSIYISGGRSGAHTNPSITLALAVYRGFPFKQVPVYWAAQLLGAFLGAAITYALYLPALNEFEGGSSIRTLSGPHGTGELFVTVPQIVTTAASGFGTELVATTILTVMVLAVGDETNAPPGDGMTAVVLGLVLIMGNMALGWSTGFAVSPSRDLGPRILLSCLGYGSEIWTHNSLWWLYGPQAGCFAGALLGGLVYDTTIFTGGESPVNYTAEAWRDATPALIVRPVKEAVERSRRKARWRRSESHGAAGGSKAVVASSSDEGGTASSTVLELQERGDAA